MQSLYSIILCKRDYDVYSYSKKSSKKFIIKCYQKILLQLTLRNIVGKFKMLESKIAVK